MVSVYIKTIKINCSLFFYLFKKLWIRGIIFIILNYSITLFQIYFRLQEMKRTSLLLRIETMCFLLYLELFYCLQKWLREECNNWRSETTGLDL